MANTGARQSAINSTQEPRRTRPSRECGAATGGAADELWGQAAKTAARKARVYIAAENRLLQEALARMMAERGEIDVVGVNSSMPFQAEALLEAGANILLLASRGRLPEDLLQIRKVRTTAPEVRIMLLGMTKEAAEFLQCVRAGISGYLLQEASAEDVLKSVRAVQAGEAVCPRSLCAVLFRYFEQEATTFPSARVQQLMGLTRREQQLIPLIAQGLTNKEIANHFFLSEQTVKNHLYRMKNKVGAENRLGIVQLCRTQGFLL